MALHLAITRLLPSKCASAWTAKASASSTIGFVTESAASLSYLATAMRRETRKGSKVQSLQGSFSTADHCALGSSLALCNQVLQGAQVPFKLDLASSQDCCFLFQRNSQRKLNFHLSGRSRGFLVIESSQSFLVCRIQVAHQLVLFLCFKLPFDHEVCLVEIPGFPLLLQGSFPWNILIPVLVRRQLGQHLVQKSLLLRDRQVQALQFGDLESLEVSAEREWWISVEVWAFEI